MPGVTECVTENDTALANAAGLDLFDALRIAFALRDVDGDGLVDARGRAGAHVAAEDGARTRRRGRFAPSSRARNDHERERRRARASDRARAVPASLVAPVYDS